MARSKKPTKKSAKQPIARATKRTSKSKPTKASSSRIEVIDDDGVIVVCSTDAIVEHPEVQFPNDLLAAMKARTAVGVGTPCDDTYSVSVVFTKPEGAKKQLRGPFPLRVGPLGVSVLPWSGWTIGDKQSGRTKVPAGDYAVTLRADPDDDSHFEVYLERGTAKPSAKVPSFAPADPLALSETAQTLVGLASNILGGMELVPGQGYVKRPVSKRERREAEQLARAALKQYRDLGKRGARAVALVEELMAKHELTDGPIKL